MFGGEGEILNSICGFVYPHHIVIPVANPILFACGKNERVRSSRSLSKKKKPHYRVAFLFGGEGEIRTLEQCYPLHDFQSCALDQLGDFSMVVVYYFLAVS